MEQLAAFLRQVGYTVWKGGTEHFSSEFLTVLKDAHPIGFILADYSALATTPEEKKILNGLTAFWERNSKAPGRGQSEFLLLFWKGNEITTNFDIQTGEEIYNLYLRGKAPERLHTLNEALQKLEKAYPISGEQKMEGEKKEEQSPKSSHSFKHFPFWRKREMPKPLDVDGVAT